MGRSRKVRFVIRDDRDQFEYDTKRYGKVSEKGAIAFIQALRKSTEAGGVNAHLGETKFFPNGAEIYDQFNRVVVVRVDNEKNSDL